MTRAEEIMCHQRDEKFADAQEKRPIKAKLGGKIELKNVSFGYSRLTLEKMDATRVVIAHQLSTIMRRDHIIVLDAGRIIEQGSYEELMAKQGMFYKLARRQKV